MSRLRISAIAALIILLTLNLSAFAKTEIPDHTDEFFVNDFANVLDSETEQFLYETGKNYSSDGGPQIVVLTMKSIGFKSVEDFALDTARKWGIGSEDSDNGVLILVVTDSRDIRIEVGYGLEDVLNDGKCGRFIRNASDMLASGDYNGGIRQIYTDIIGEIEEPTPDDNDDDIAAVAAIIVLIIIVVVILLSFRGKKKPNDWDGGFYIGGGFGGFGGSSNSGSSGFGGGGFSGGGGSFGGGGASGKF